MAGLTAPSILCAPHSYAGERLHRGITMKNHASTSGLTAISFTIILAASLPLQADEQDALIITATRTAETVDERQDALGPDDGSVLNDKSGTTVPPKPAALSHLTLAPAARTATDIIPLRDQDPMISYPSPSPTPEPVTTHLSPHVRRHGHP